MTESEEKKVNIKQASAPVATTAVTPAATTAPVAAPILVAPAAEPNSDIHDSLMNKHSGIVVKNTENKWSDWRTLIDAKNDGFRLYKDTNLDTFNLLKLSDDLSKDLITTKPFDKPSEKYYLVNSINTDGNASEILMIEGYMTTTEPATTSPITPEPVAAVATEPAAAEKDAKPAKPATEPVATEKTPVATEKTPVATEKTPVATEKTPVATEKTPVATPAAKEAAAKEAAAKEAAAKEAAAKEAAAAKAAAATRDPPKQLIDAMRETKKTTPTSKKGGYQHKKRKSLKKYHKKSPGK